MAINSLSTLTEFPSLWSQNGTSIYYNSGNLGIGLSNPGFNLDVVGDINFSGDLLQNGVVMTFGQFDTDGDGTSIVYNNGGEVVLDKIRSNTLGDGVFTIRDCTNSTGKWQNRIGTDDSYNLDYYNGSSWSNCVFVDTIGLNVNATSGERLSIRNASGISNNEDLGGVSWMQEGSTGTVVGNIFMLGDSDGGTTGRGKMFFGVRGNDSNQSAICQMSLDSFGNVNIGGNFNSSSKLYVGKTSWGINEANPLVNFAVTASGTNGSGSYTSRIMKLYSDGSFTSEVDNDDNIIGLEIEMDVTGPVNKIPLRITGDNNYNYDFTSQSNGVTPGTRLDMFVGSSAGDFSFSNSGGELLRIKGSGNVGIGTDSPEHTLHVRGSGNGAVIEVEDTAANGNPVFRLKNDAQEWQWQLRGAESDSLVAWDVTGVTGRLYLTTAGNLGLGASSPVNFSNQTSLTVNGTSVGRVDVKASGSGGGAMFGTSSALTMQANSGVALNLDSASGQPITFQVGSSEKARITSAGVMQVGGQTGTLKLGNDGTYHGTIEWEYANNELAHTINNVGVHTFNTNGKEVARFTQSTSNSGGLILKSNAGNDLIAMGAEGSGGNEENGFIAGYQNGTQKFSIGATTGPTWFNTGQNFGIGTDSPSYPLHIARSAGSTCTLLNLQSCTNSSEGNRVQLAFSSQVALDSQTRINAAIDSITHSVAYSHYGDLAFLTMNAAALTEKMRITSDGKVGLGSNAPVYLFDMGSGNARNIRVGTRTFIGSGYSGSSTILGYNVIADESTTATNRMIITETSTGNGLPAAINMFAGNMEFHTAPSGTINDEMSCLRLRIINAGTVEIYNAADPDGTEDSLRIYAQDGDSRFTVGNNGANHSAVMKLSNSTGAITHCLNSHGGIACHNGCVISPTVCGSTIVKTKTLCVCEGTLAASHPRVLLNMDACKTDVGSETATCFRVSVNADNNCSIIYTGDTANNPAVLCTTAAHFRACGPIGTQSCFCGKQIVLCQEGTGNEMLACFTRHNSGNADNHFHKIDVNPDNNLVTLTSSGTNAGGYCMFCYVNSNCFTASVIVKGPILCATTQVTAPQGFFSSATIPLAIQDPGVATYYWCFPNNDTVSFHPNTTSTKTLYFCNAGTGSMNVCVEGCVKTPVFCATSCSYIGESRMGAGFSTYTNDGLFSSDARPSSMGLPNGSEMIFGYYSAGNGFYWGRVAHRSHVDSLGVYGSSGSIYCQSWGARSANVFTVEIAGTDRLKVDANGVCIIGHLNSNPTGLYNVVLGPNNFGNSTTGSTSNVVVADGAALGVTDTDNSVFIGKGSGGVSGINTELQTGTGNVFIGYGAGPDAAASNYQVVIGGDYAVGKGSQTSFLAPSSGAYQGNNSASWSTTSDERLKKNIVDNYQGIELISQIRVRNFEYRLEDEIDDEFKQQKIQREGIQIGVIAQELQEIFPDAVTEKSSGLLSVDNDELFWYMINAIKELNDRVEQLENQTQ